MPGTGTAETTRTVVVAGVANLGIAAAKAVAGGLSGSAAMMSEAAHSLADTVTEVLLYVSLRRGARPADDLHPFGYGMTSYFWALLAAGATLIAGAGFAVTHGIHTIRDGERLGNPTVSYVVLVVAFVMESVSFARAVRQLRQTAGRHGTTPLRVLRMTGDTAVKAVTLEDAAALIGLILAGAGLTAAHLTGSALWDGLASVVIGLLLAVVAVALTHANVSLLIGRSVPRTARRRILAELSVVPGIDRVADVRTMYLGPATILVAAQVDFADAASSGQVEAAADEAERRLAALYPAIRHVYLDPTPSLVVRHDA